MRFSLQVQYAICGVFDIAYNGEGEPVQIRMICERQGIPVRYLEQIFQRLRRADLVVSKRGPGGGYMLGRPPSQITLGEVVEAVEGPLSDVLEMTPTSAASNDDYRPNFLWRRLAERFAKTLEGTRLDALCREAAHEEVRRAHPQEPMYFI